MIVFMITGKLVAADFIFGLYAFECPSSEAVLCVHVRGNHKEFYIISVLAKIRVAQNPRTHRRVG